MKCSGFVIDDSTEFLRGLNRKMARLRVPVSGSIELTRFCNLKCVHCYIRPVSAEEVRSTTELDTGTWLAIIDQIAEAGCLNLLITGGEPMLRSDFPAIYSHAKKKGLLVTVFTNGTLVTEEAAALFRELPPQSVEVTVYGASKQTYEGITGVAGSYERSLAGPAGAGDRLQRLDSVRHRDGDARAERIRLHPRIVFL